MSRAERRHKKRLIKKKVRKYWGCHGEDDPVIIGKKASAPKPTSSCSCCMNRRKIDGETRQERKYRLSDQDDT